MQTNLRILSWNINHRGRARNIPLALSQCISSLNPDIVVLTEYVFSEKHRDFFQHMSHSGLKNHLISVDVPEENRVIVFAKSDLICGEIAAPDIAPSVPSNALHVILPQQKIGLLGYRLPDYSRQPKIRRACWDWLLAIGKQNVSRPFVIIGDFNTDDRYPSSKCGDRLAMLVEQGWQQATPKSGASYWNFDNKPLRIDHAFVSPHFHVKKSEYITDYHGKRMIGRGNAFLSDHAILLIELELKRNSQIDSINHNHVVLGNRLFENRARELLKQFPAERIERTRDVIQIFLKNTVIAMMTPDFLEIRLPTIEWTEGSHGPVESSRLWERLSWHSTEQQNIAKLIEDARAVREAEFKPCRFCSGKFPVELRHGDSCHACAEKHVGIVH